MICLTGILVIHLVLIIIFSLFENTVGSRNDREQRQSNSSCSKKHTLTPTKDKIQFSVLPHYLFFHIIQMIIN